MSKGNYNVHCTSLVGSFAELNVEAFFHVPLPQYYRKSTLFHCHLIFVGREEN